MFRTSLSTLTVACSLLALSLGLNAQTTGTPERYAALAVNMDRGSAGTIEIVVDRWSTDQQRDTLMSVMKKEGPVKLLDALQSTPCWKAWTPSGLARSATSSRTSAAV
jgi:hypothetical protein